MSTTVPIISLQIQADPNVHGSFIACLCAILGSWGRKADYANIAGLSGTAFSPVLDTGENCHAWWTEGGDDIRLDFLSRALGFTVEKVTGHQNAEWDTHPEPGALPDSRRRYLCMLKRALADGQRVIVRTRPSWSVLTGWSDDISRLPFATVPSFEKLCADIQPPHKTDLAYIFTPDDPTLLQEDAVHDALIFRRTGGRRLVRKQPIQVWRRPLRRRGRTPRPRTVLRTVRREILYVRVSYLSTCRRNHTVRHRVSRTNECRHRHTSRRTGTRRRTIPQPHRHDGFLSRRKDPRCRVERPCVSCKAEGKRPAYGTATRRSSEGAQRTCGKLKARAVDAVVTPVRFLKACPERT